VTSPPGGWAEAVRELRFTFGEFRICTARFRAWIMQAHFLACDERSLEAIPPFSEVPPGVEVLVVPSQPVQTDFPKLTRLSGGLRYVPAHFNHYCIELPGTFPDYMAGLSGKSRHEMVRKVRRFAEFAAGRHALREFRSPSEMRDFMRFAGPLSRATYQERLLGVGLPDSPAFVDELERAAANDDVRGYILLIEDRPVAYGYCRAAGDVLLFEHTGYDPEIGVHSPGIFLLHEMLARICSEKRFRVFDFGTGDAQYKRSYATTSRRCAAVYYFRRSLLNGMIVRAHLAVTSLSDACVRLLKALGIKDRVRKLLRRGGSRDADDGPGASRKMPAKAGQGPQPPRNAGWGGGGP
jgi:hypothetical protein